MIYSLQNNRLEGDFSVDQTLNWRLSYILAPVYIFISEGGVRAQKRLFCSPNFPKSV